MPSSSLSRMKAALATLLILACYQSLKAQSLSEITTLDGRLFRECEIVRVYPDGVSFRHRTGAAKVLFNDLSPALRASLGYDPSKAQAYEKQITAKREAEAQARKREAEVMAKAEEAKFQALAAAAQRDHLRSLGLEAQARATAMRGASQQHTAGVPQLPELGAVFSPSGVYRQTFVQPGWLLPWQGGYISPGLGWGGYYAPCAPPPRTGSVRFIWRP
jgi:hypothetical protein